MASLTVGFELMGDEMSGKSEQPLPPGPASRETSANSWKQESEMRETGSC